MIDLSIIWQTQWDLLPLDPIGVAYPTNIASFLAARLINMSIAPPFFGSPVFTFNSATFAAGIAGMVPDPTGTIAPGKFATAFTAACTASVWLVPSGSYIGSPTPPTTFSAPPVAIFDPASVAAASATLQSTLLTATPAPLPLTSVYPTALYAAFSSLMVTLTGINSIVPTPTPLIYTGLVL
jgi:hypothetical protein